MTAHSCKGKTASGADCKRMILHGDYCYQHITFPVVLAKGKQGKVFPKTGFKQDKPDECPVCCESMDTQKEALECGHWVHTDCLIASAKAECPLCRTAITLNEKDMKEIKRLAKRNEQERIEEEHRELLEQNGVIVLVQGDLEEITGETRLYLETLVSLLLEYEGAFAIELG